MWGTPGPRGIGQKWGEILGKKEQNGWMWGRLGKMGLTTAKMGKNRQKEWKRSKMRNNEQ